MASESAGQVEESRLPALSSLFGHRPAQEIRVSGSWEAAHVRPIGTKTYTAKCCGTCRAMIVAFAHRARFALVAARGGHMQPQLV